MDRKKFAEVIQMAHTNILKQAEKEGMSCILTYTVRKKGSDMEETSYWYWHTSISVHDAAAHEKYVRDSLNCLDSLW